MDPTNEIAAALANAQLEMHNPVFDSVNPHFRSRYASMAATRNAIVYSRHNKKRRVGVLQNDSLSQKWAELAFWADGLPG